MNTLDLYHQIEQLPAQEQIALIKQILTGLAQQMPSDMLMQKENGKSVLPKHRIAGLHAGMIWVSDDFDEPLTDEFWLGDS